MKGNGKPLFVLANAVDDRTMAITHVIRGEDQLPTTPRQIMLWGALERRRGQGPRPARLRPPAAAGQRAGQEAVQAAGPGRGGDVPGAGLPAGGLPQLPGAAGLEPRRRGDRAGRGDHRALPARGRAALAGLLRHEEALAHQRRLHPRAVRGRLRGRGASVGRPGAGGVGAGRLARSRHRRAGRRAPALAARALRRRRLRRAGGR